jgi:hypothetical protein
MSTSVLPSTLIFINSKSRLSGTPYDFYLNFNNELIKAPKGCYIQLNVEQASINRSWYTIQSGYNTFVIDNVGGSTTTITFPVGYYNAADIRTLLQQTMPTWTFSYDKKTNKLTFTAPTDSGSWTGITQRKFIFTNGSISDMLGFDQTETPTFTQASPTIISSKPIKVNDDASIYIRTNIPRQKLSALDNISTIIKESDVLCSIPIQSAPFDNVVYSKNNSANFSYNVLAPYIHGCRIYLTNEQGTPIQVPYDWTLTLSVSYTPYQTNNDTPILKDIRDYIKLYLLHNVKDLIENEDSDSQ